MTRIRAAVAAASVSVLLLTACGGGEGSSSAPDHGPATVKVSVIPIVDVIIARSKGLPLKVVAPGNASTGVKGKDFGGVVVKAGSLIRTAKDLVGKRVAVNTLNNINDTTVRASIRAAGGDARNVHFTELAFPDMLAALDKGDVDAVQVVEPFLTTALKNGGRLVASNYVDTAPNLTIAGYFTSRKTAASKPDLVKRFATATRKSLDYAAHNPGAVRAILSTYTKIDPSLSGSLTLPEYPARVDVGGLRTLENLAVRDGLIKKAPDNKDLLP